MRPHRMLVQGSRGRMKVKIALFGVGLTMCLSLVLWWPPSQKYHLGMTIQEAESFMTKAYPVDKAAISYKGGPSEKQMEEDPLYMIEVKNQGVRLFFNSHERLIRIKKWWQF